jgi:arabinogalactan oligomer/maltooligosaccharide transport system permease protein
LGIVTALLLFRQGILFKSWWRSIFILPWAIPEFVGALMWTQVFDPKFGWLQLAANSWSQTADYPGAGSLLSGWQDNPATALGVLLITATWYGFPFMMLAATAGLKLIPNDIFDAAQIDGAGTLSLFKHIIWPVLLPLVIPAIIIRSIFAFNQFYIFYAFNPPYPVLTYASISFYFFSQAGQYAVSAAFNIFTMLLLLLMMAILNRSGKLLEGVTYA